MSAAPSTLTDRHQGLRRVTRRYDVVVAGGGMAGIGAAVTAARHGARVALIQDRPVLGGNASKEVRVWLQGASGGANAAWFHETGLMEELLLENQYRNQTGQYELWDALLLETVLGQERLELFLNTAIQAVEMDRSGVRPRVAAIEALTLHSETITRFEAAQVIDCTGDGTLGYLAGAPYLTGREARADFGESMAPQERRANTLGGSILFQAKDLGRAVEFVAPAFAHRFTEQDFRAGRHPVHEFDRIRGGFWWVEWGGTLDTIHDNEAIKIELLKIAYGLFDWLKNDPSQREKNRTLTLEWVGTIPGKRESRRFVGEHILTEHDVVGRADFPDAIAYGGWNLDDHAAKGFFDEVEPPSTHTHIPGTYNIPLRCLFSRDVANLWFAGRDVSATHVALTSVRVMLTCAQMGEAAGAASAMCAARALEPRALLAPPAIAELRERLLYDDHHIVGARSRHPRDLCLYEGVRASASSQLEDLSLERADGALPLDRDRLLLFPSFAGELPWIEVLLSVTQGETLRWRLHRGDGRGLTIPSGVLAEGGVGVVAGERQWVRIPLDARIARDDWAMLELTATAGVAWHLTHERRVGIMSWAEGGKHSGRNSNRHCRFERLRGASNHCFRLPGNPRAYAASAAIDGFLRPYCTPSLWVSQPSDFARPQWLQVDFAAPSEVAELQALFDPDLEHHPVNCWTQLPCRVEPDLVRDYELQLRLDGAWRTVAAERANRHRRRHHVLPRPLRADAVRLLVHATNGTPRAQVYALRAFSPR
jgi:hypothetical protein